MEQNKSTDGTTMVDSAAERARQAATTIVGQGPVATGAAAESEVRQLMEEFADAIRSGKINEIMSFYDPSLVAFDIAPPLRFTNAADYRKNWENMFTTMFEFPVNYEFNEEKILASGDLAVFHALIHTQGAFKNPPPEQDKNMEAWIRYSCCLKKANNRWRIYHEHCSVPVAEDGKALMNLKPGYQISH